MPRDKRNYTHPFFRFSSAAGQQRAELERRRQEKININMRRRENFIRKKSAIIQQQEAILNTLAKSSEGLTISQLRKLHDIGYSHISERLENLYAEGKVTFQREGKHRKWFFKR